MISLSSVAVFGWLLCSWEAPGAHQPKWLLPGPLRIQSMEPSLGDSGGQQAWSAPMGSAAQQQRLLLNHQIRNRPGECWLGWIHLLESIGTQCRPRFSCGRWRHEAQSLDQPTRPTTTKTQQKQTDLSHKWTGTDWPSLLAKKLNTATQTTKLQTSISSDLFLPLLQKVTTPSHLTPKASLQSIPFIYLRCSPVFHQKLPTCSLPQPPRHRLSVCPLNFRVESVSAIVVV